KHYNIENIPTLLRGTLREEGYCRGWDAFVQLGLTDDQCKIENSEALTYKDVVEAFLPAGNSEEIEKRVAAFLNIPEDNRVMMMLRSTGIFDAVQTGLKDATAAMILQDLLEKKWVLKKDDKDMIIMVHLVEYILKGKKELLTSSLIVKGDDQVITAMAK